VTVLPCQDFNEFLASNHLRVRQVSFITDLLIFPITSFPWDVVLLKRTTPPRRFLPICHGCQVHLQSPQDQGIAGLPSVPDVQVQHSPHLPFAMGWGPTQTTTLPLSGGHLLWTSPCLGWQTHPSNRLATIFLPPGLALAPPQAS
jgi:hypothetical protein